VQVLGSEEELPPTQCSTPAWKWHVRSEVVAAVSGAVSLASEVVADSDSCSDSDSEARATWTSSVPEGMKHVLGVVRR
jgi:hypothetical protein